MTSYSRRAVLAFLLAFPVGACQDRDPDLLQPDISQPPAFARNEQNRGGGGGGTGTNAKIAFVTATGISTMNADGSRITAVPNTQDAQSPTWSPDRKKLVFSITSGSAAGLYLINANGTGRTKLYTGLAGGPDWSPDGTRIIFTAIQGQESHLFAISPDGTNLQQVTAVGTRNSSPSFSADGSEIAWISNRDPGEGIWVMNSNGTNRRLLKACTNCSMPRWSPVIGDQRIAYNLHFPGNFPFTSPKAWIVIMHLDGSPGASVGIEYGQGTTQLYPTWSPDATKIVFAGNTPSGRDLYQVSSLGGFSQQLTNTPGEEKMPAWAN